MQKRRIDLALPEVLTRFGPSREGQERFLQYPGFIGEISRILTGECDEPQRMPHETVPAFVHGFRFSAPPVPGICRLPDRSRDLVINTVPTSSVSGYLVYSHEDRDSYVYR